MKILNKGLYSRIKMFLWPIRINKLLYLLRRLRHKYQRIYLVKSPVSGPISVWDLGRQREMVFSEEYTYPQSVIFTRGCWGELQREFWGWLVQPPLKVTLNPHVLILGLGGGTTVHLAQRLLNPKSITAVELDPEVVQVAKTYMGLNDIQNLEFRVQDVHQALKELISDKKYDLIIEDIFYLGFSIESSDFLRAYINSLVNVSSPNGVLIFNRWFGSEEKEARQVNFTQLLNEQFNHVIRKRIVQRWGVELTFATSLKSR